MKKIIYSIIVLILIIWVYLLLVYVAQKTLPQQVQSSPASTQSVLEFKGPIGAPKVSGPTSPPPAP